MTWLEQARDKSPRAKRRLALTVAATVTGVIFLVWLTAGVGPSLTDDQLADQPPEQYDGTPFQAIQAQVAGGWGSVTAGWISFEAWAEDLWLDMRRRFGR